MINVLVVLVFAGLYAASALVAYGLAKLRALLPPSNPVADAVVRFAEKRRRWFPLSGYGGGP